MPIIIDDNLKIPLYKVLAKIGGLWIVANLGYFLVFPLLGYGLSYNSAPIIFALYFLLWTTISISYFKDLFSALLPSHTQIWLYAALSFGCGVVVWGLLYILSIIPVLRGPFLAPYSDILFATPWYFLPKSVEVLLQQVLIAALVYALAVRFHTFKKIKIAYAITFGSAHLLMFITGSPGVYAGIMMVGALISTLMFPYLILKVRGGFVVAYTIHLIFYIFLAMALHAWPPPNYSM